MAQYTSRGSDRIEDDIADEELGLVQISLPNPLFGVDDDENFTSPKFGGKAAKDARRYVNTQKANDELIIYAHILPRINKYTAMPSRHTGEVMLHVFYLDRNFPEES